MNVLDRLELRPGSERRERFAEAVLRILAYDADWSADTLDLIAEAAVDHGLAQADDAGDFQPTTGAIR